MSTTFAKNLKAYRAIARMSQADLARAAGITRSVVNNYEMAHSEPSFDNLCKMARVLGVDITDLIEEHSEYPDYVRSVRVTDKESLFLQVYREADPVYQEVAFDILRAHKKED